jgi:hypothetical protein
VGIDDPIEDFHSKMIEIDVVACLVGLLQKSNLHKQESSTVTEAIITLLNFSMLLYYFELLKS